LWRETWERLDKNGQGNHDFAWLDQGFTASVAAGKTMGLEILAGNFTPPWFFALPGAESIVSGHATDLTTIPWDPVFQREWEAVQQALAARYKANANLRYVKLIGVGTGSESYFAIDDASYAAANALAIEDGYSGVDEAWQTGARWLIDMFVRIWAPIPSVLGTGSPYDRTGGTGAAALQAVMNYGDTMHRGLFGARADDLNRGMTQGGQGIIAQLSPHCVGVGFQFLHVQLIGDPNPPDSLDASLVAATDTYGAHLVELFAQDADDSRSGPVIDSANVRMEV
jgi:hypothetical protein